MAQARPADGLGDVSLAAVRRRPDVARIVRAWRELTTAPSARRIGPGERTLVACSGGADSSALLMALASAPGASKRLVVGHVVHDLRPEKAAAEDRDTVRRLAEALKLAFVESSVLVREGRGNGEREVRNLEARARRLRYAALKRMGAEQKCAFLATGHHADDQLETMLMALMRGAGPRGLAGVAVRRKERVEEGGTIWIIRPMLGDRLGRVPATTRAEAEAICAGAGWKWCVDQTNQDTAMLRNAVRMEIAPALERLRPGTALRATRCTAILRDAARVVGLRAHELSALAESDGARLVWDRSRLRREPSVVVGELVAHAAQKLAPGRRRDRLSRSAVAPVLAAIADAATEPRRFVIGPLAVRVTSRQVVAEAIAAD